MAKKDSALGALQLASHYELATDDGWLCSSADLVVADDLTFFDSAAERRTKDLMHLLFILARGVPVVTHTAMRLAEGDHNLIPAKSVIWPKRLRDCKVAFHFSTKFYYGSKEIWMAVKSCCAIRGSQWSMSVVDPDSRKTTKVFQPLKSAMQKSETI